ncbi:MAG TPA: hypothetical protein VKQ71_09520, partial [Acidimicrobiales bacterium]|nr:hypothetical protein [Acidimicrobiales bacterium]
LPAAPMCVGVPLALGPLDVMCGSPAPAFRTGLPWKGSSWTGSSWTGSSWTGSSWTGSSWTSAGYDKAGLLTAFWGDGA